MPPEALKVYFKTTQKSPSLQNITDISKPFGERDGGAHSSLLHDSCANILNDANYFSFQSTNKGKKTQKDLRDH